MRQSAARAAEQRHERAALDACRRAAGQLDHGGRDVERETSAAARLPAAPAAGSARGTASGCLPRRRSAARVRARARRRSSRCRRGTRCRCRSSCPVRSSASSSIPTPSSTEAIIAARSRISSCVPACIAASTACARSVALRRKASAQAGFCPHHLRGRQHVRPRREHAAPVEVPVALGRPCSRRGSDRACRRRPGGRPGAPPCGRRRGSTASRAAAPRRRPPSAFSTSVTYPGTARRRPSTFSSGSKSLPWPSKLTQRSYPGRGEPSLPMCHLPTCAVS